jgi:hypothetical protein
MAGLDAAIAAQLQVMKATMGHPMMGAPPLPHGMPAGVAGIPGMTALAPQAVMPQGLPPIGAGPTNSNLLSVAVNHMPFRYQLAEADLGEMCKRWGALQNVQIYRDGSREVGVITFADPIDASDCQRQLNGHHCTFDGPAGGAQGSLVVIIGTPEQLGGPPLPKPQAMHGPPMGAPGPMGAPPQMVGQASPGAFPQGAPQMMGNMVPQGGMPTMPANGKGGKGSPAWSCKVTVQAERMHMDFPIVAKICGQNNMNFEHIRSQGNCSVEIRGQRSGTLDPRTGQEHAEPMFLLLASDSPDSGLATLEMVKDLLGSVYDEHATWCAANNFQWQQNLQPQVVENPHLMEGFFF